MTVVYKIIFALGLVYLLTGCEPKWSFGPDSFEPQIVVEGWIEDGQFPIVCLTQSVGLDTPTDSAAMLNVPIRWAKVTVSDGSISEVLTGRTDLSYFPPYIYKGYQIQGEVGKTYTLTVEYSGRTLTATTYIPQPVPLKNIIVEKCADSDTLYQIKAFFEDSKADKNYYKFFTLTMPNDRRFYSSFMGTFDDEVLTGNDACITVFRGFRQGNYKNYTPFYKKKEIVLVKFTQLPEEGFLFWSSYENEVSNGKNPLFPSSTNLKSNIKGGLGIWCGYGARTYFVGIR